MEGSATGESLEEFRQSFSYGSRSNLNFKFLKSMSDDDAAEFIRILLQLVSDAYDTGDIGPVIDAAVAAQIQGYTPAEDAPKGTHGASSGPFASMRFPVGASTIGLVTSSGHFVEGDDPQPLGVESMTQQEAMDRISEFLRDTPVLSEIPSDTERSSLRVRHGGYDIQSAELDPNVAFPWERMAEAKSRGRIGDISRRFWSFPGATSRGRLRKELPMWLDRINEDHVDATVLVPV